MPTLICPHDKAENPSGTLVCIQCGRRLSRVEVGSVFHQRYRILERLDENKLGFCYRVELRSTGKPGLLREIIPTEAGCREQIVRFDRAARHLIQARPRCLVPVLEHFMHQSCYYTLEGMPPAPTLRDTITKKGALPEQRAGALLDDLLSGLKELYSLNPPVYVAALDASKVLINGASTPVFLASSYISDAVLQTAPPSIGEILRQDLTGAAYSATEALIGRPSPDTQNVSDAFTHLKDLTFAATLEWIFNSTSAAPDLLQKVEQLRGLLASAQSEMRARNFDKAVELFNAAHLLSPSPRAKAALDEAEAAVKIEPPPPPPPREESPTPEEPKQHFPEPHPAPSTALTWTCAACRQSNGDSALYCGHCGRPKVQTVEASSASPVAQPRKSAVKALVLTISALAIVLVAMGAGWYWYTALMRNFDSALTKGWLFSPQGVSAYDYYKKALDADGPAGSRVREMNAKATTRLHRLTDEQFAQWYQTSRLDGASWDDLAEAEEWLTQIDSDDVTSQIRKEYADAQLNFLHNHFSEALAGFQSALQRAQNWDLAMLGVGKSCFELKRYDCAEEYYHRAEQLEPGWIWPHRNLMELYRSPERRNIPASCSEYRQLMDLSSQMTLPPFNREAAQKKMESVCRGLNPIPENSNPPQP